jgi:hypothetical protein
LKAEWRSLGGIQRIVDLARSVCFVVDVTDGETRVDGVRVGAGRVPSDRTLAKRVVEWFWQGAALARARAALPQRGDRAFHWVARAKQSDALAYAAWSTPELGGEIAALDLYRQAAYWSLCVLNRGAFERALHQDYSESVWENLDDRTLAPLLGNGAADGDAYAQLVRANFVSLASLPETERALACVRLQSLSAALLQRVADERSDYLRITRRRVERVGALLLVVCSAIIAIGVLGRPHDLALGAAWHTSSSYGVPGCDSPEQTCPTNNGYFFHTTMEDRDSWVEFDLGDLKRVSRVVTDNRSDCCPERAIPLAVEVSNADGRWQKVAERDQPFSQWSASFPVVSTRRVRLRLLRPGPLHLEHVSIY